jgi:hypothetical protein
MMDGKTPETCWAVNKRQNNKLKNCCIRLVIYLNCTMMHGLTNLKWYEPLRLCKKPGISWLADELSFPRTLKRRVTTSTRHITWTMLSATSFVIYGVYITRLVLKSYFTNWSSASTVCHFQITLIKSYTFLSKSLSDPKVTPSFLHTLHIINRFVWQFSSVSPYSFMFRFLLIFFFTGHDGGSLKRKVSENYYWTLRQRYWVWFDIQRCKSSEVNSLLFTLVTYS